MPDRLTPQQRHHIMSSIRASSTKPELKLRRALWRRGYRYRINDRRFAGTPDIVLPKYRTAIFVHGCFWHGHKGCKYYTIPQTNTSFWVDKIERNRERDQKAWRMLEAKGWKVIIVWECQLKKDNFLETVFRVSQEIVRNGELYRLALENRKQGKIEYLRQRKEKEIRKQALLDEVRSI